MSRFTVVAIGFLMTASLLASGRQVRFAAASTFPSVVKAPLDLAVGDFNHDGLPDIVVGDGINTIAVRLGKKPGGTFGEAVTYTLDLYVQRQIAVADFNDDGMQDLAVEGGGHNVPSSLALFPGNGDGTFGPATYFSTDGNGSWISLATGDFNRDGSLDIVLSGNGASTVLLGDSAGGFQAGPILSAPGFGVTVGDFNHDGNLDFATAAGYFQGVYVLLGNGDGSFKEPVVYNGGNQPVGIATADFNHDGNLDLAVAAYDDFSAMILFGSGDGAFSAGPEFFVGASPAVIAASDFNRDGRVDLAISDYGQSAVSALVGKGDGTFTPPLFFPTGNNPAFVAAADFNRDGSPDLAVTNNADNTVSILLNDAGTRVLLKSSMNPSQVGQPVTFTAKVSATVDSTRLPSGKVIFRDGKLVLGRFDLSDGLATMTTSALSHGHHKISAQYSGDNFLNPSESVILIQEVR